MSTNATIIQKVQDDKFRAIYLHWDGYEEHALVELKNGYQTFEDVTILMNQGDCSELHREIEKCVFYKRDKNEENVDAIEGTLEEILKYFDNSFNYIFKNNKWTRV